MAGKERRGSNGPSLKVRDLLRALKAKCLDCCAGVRAEVDKCKARDCPLFGYRRAQGDAEASLPTA